MNASVNEILSSAETVATSGDAILALTALRKLSLQEFGELLISLPSPRYPNISKLLPQMASAEVQRNWTGNDGVALLYQTNAFVNLLSQFVDLGSARRILDFGCGYGRIIRGLYYFCNPHRLYGCDPWEESIRLCKEANLLGHFAVSDYLPQRLPFNERFDLIYAFSVFTHLSERATQTCLDTLIRANTGLIAITVRPVEYWNNNPDVSDEARREFVLRHSTDEFAFRPHNRAPVDGDVTYGDSSFSEQWLRQQFPSIEVVTWKQIPDDPMQILVLIRNR